MIHGLKPGMQEMRTDLFLTLNPPILATFQGCNFRKMPQPSEHKTVQARILAYAQEIGWKFVPREEAEERRGFDPDAATPRMGVWLG